MSGSTQSRLNCEAARVELPALLYEELTGDVKARIEDHLEACHACRAELETHRQTMRKLDEWALAHSPSRSSTPWPVPSRRRRQGWLRPVLVGAAAAVIAFAALSVLGVSVTYTDGRLVVSLGRGVDASFGESGHGRGKHLPALQEVARDVVNSRIEELLTGLETDLLEMERSGERRRRLLVQAVDQSRDADLHRFATIMEALVTGQEQETQRVRRFQDDMMVWRNAVEEKLGGTPDEQETKEDS